MRSQVIAPWRWICWHRRELAVTAAFAPTVTLLVFAGPWLILLAAVEWKTGPRRKRLLGLALATWLLWATVWLWRDLRGVPHGRWHPCAQCHAPIEEPSRAWYCSPACRRYARLERDAEAFDPRIAQRAQQRLLLTECTALDPALTEIPF